MPTDRTNAPTNSQLATIHALVKRAAMDDDTYRAMLEGQTGKRSAKDITKAQAGAVIERLLEITGRKPAARGAVSGLDSPTGRKLRALWIAGFDLGVVRARADHAMLSFLERQCRVSHVRFLREPGAGRSAIEALKQWLARSALVSWPADTTDIIASKRAVLNAQWLRLVEIGAVKPWVAHGPLTDLDTYAFKIIGMNGWNFFEPHHYDEVQNALGRKLRAALADARRVDKVAEG